jgi:hypothetical protein
MTGREIEYVEKGVQLGRLIERVNSQSELDLKFSLFVSPDEMVRYWKINDMLGETIKTSEDLDELIKWCRGLLK